jgi:hypothetical protein
LVPLLCVFHAYALLVRKPEGKRLLGRPRHRWKDNVRIHFREIGWEGVDWMHMVEDRDQWQAVMNVVMNFWVP